MFPEIYSGFGPIFCDYVDVLLIQPCFLYNQVDGEIQYAIIGVLQELQMFGLDRVIESDCLSRLRIAINDSIKREQPNDDSLLEYYTETLEPKVGFVLQSLFENDSSIKTLNRIII